MPLCSDRFPSISAFLVRHRAVTLRKEAFDSSPVERTERAYVEAEPELALSGFVASGYNTLQISFYKHLT